MRIKPTPALDMFAAHELQERTAHFPAPSDEAAVLDLWRETFTRYDAAMRAGDTAAALVVAEDADLLRKYVHGATLGCAHTQARLAEATAAPDGELPMWGQAGKFEIEYKGIRVLVEVDGLCGIASFSSLMPHFSLRIVEKHRLFVSETGYRSCFTHLSEAVKGQGLAFAIHVWLCDHVERDLKGKLVRYVPFEERDAAARTRIAAIASAPDELDGELDDEDDSGVYDGLEDEGRSRIGDTVDDEEDDEEDELDILACVCGASLSQLDHHFILPCGAMCPTCASAHVGVCADCAEEWDEPEVSYPATLPGMVNVHSERAEAVRMEVAARLSLDFTAPLPSISGTTREIETFSPLFRESTATHQLSLF